MTKYEIALQLWQNDPFIKSVREEAKLEAKRLGRGFCADQFIFAPKGPNGKVGALHLVAQRVPQVQLIEGSDKRYPDSEVLLWLRRFLEKTTPNCGHVGRNGEESFCSPSYPVDYPASFRENAKSDGFINLIDAMRNAGKKQD